MSLKKQNNVQQGYQQENNGHHAKRNKNNTNETICPPRKPPRNPGLDRATMCNMRHERITGDRFAARLSGATRFPWPFDTSPGAAGLIRRAASAMSRRRLRWVRKRGVRGTYGGTCQNSFFICVSSLSFCPAWLDEERRVDGS